MRRSVGWWALGIGLVVVVGLIVAAAQRDRRGGPPLDPRSTSPDGTRALVLLAERYGLTVELRPGGAEPASAAGPAAGAASAPGVALVLEDRLARDDRAALVDWARDGGTIVVADPSSPLTPAIAGGRRASVPADRRTCPAGLSARAVQGAAVTFEVAPGSDSCFGDGRSAVVVVDRVGRGRVVAVGGAGPFTNALLGAVDNAGLALELLDAGGPGPGTVTVVGASPVGEGDDGLWALVPTGVRVAFLQGLVALGVFVWASARRLGQPVPEPKLRELPGSALTAAVGELYHRGHQREAAAAILRRRLRRAVVPLPGTDAGEHLRSDGAGGPGGGSPVTSDAELVELARAAAHPPHEGRP
jgi:hypothetical protein